MMTLAEQARALLNRGQAAQLVRLDRVRGSAPREAGACMLVTADACHGSIGGGHLEWAAIAFARERLATHASDPTQREYPLGASLGQCCGGHVTLSFYALEEGMMPLLEAADAERFRLWLFGAGHVGRALVGVLAAVPCTVVWVDSREHLLGSAPGHVVARPSDDPAGEVQDVRPGDYVLVMTHDHALDERIVEAVLRRGDAGFVGLIGSDTKRRRLVHRLQARGLDTSALVCPIGLPGIVGKEPGVIAIAAAAQLLLHTRAPCTPPPASETAR